MKKKWKFFIKRRSKFNDHSGLGYLFYKCDFLKINFPENLHHRYGDDFHFHGGLISFPIVYYAGDRNDGFGKREDG